MKTKTIESITLTGRVVLIDPCYVVPREGWTDFCGATPINYEVQGGGQKPLLLEHEGKEYVGLFIKTAYGDGEYAVTDSRDECIGVAGVDSGTLFIIPEELALTLWEKAKSKHRRPMLELGCLIDLGNEKVPLTAKDGLREITLGQHVTIALD